MAALDSLDSVISDKEVADIAQKYLKTWEEISPYLGLDEVVREAIRRTPGGYLEQKKAFLQEWKNRQGSRATFRALIQAAKNSNNTDLAEKLEKMAQSPVCEVESARERATVTTSGSVPLTPTFAIPTPPETSTPSQLETTATAGPVSGTPDPAGPLTPPGSSSPSSLTITTSFKVGVVVAKAEIARLEEEFSNIKSEARKSLSERESRDQSFVSTFRDHLLDLSCTKKQVHIRFFMRNEDEILNASTIQKLFAILGRHCNYTNYEIILHIVKRFCNELTERMLNYCDSLIVFEKATTVDVYLCAISARSGGKIYAGFMRMTMKINKPASECTLHEIRELKESIEEEAELKSYAVYIETPEPGSVSVRLCILEEVGWMVGVVLTPDFRQKHLLSEVTVRSNSFKEKNLTEYLSMCKQPKMAEERRSVSLEHLQQILLAAYHRYQELVPALELMIQYRTETLSQLNCMADQLEKRHHGENVVKVASSTVGIAGTATAAAGAALTPVTLGFSLAILAGGARLATLGSVTKKVCERVDLEKVQEAIDRDKAQCEAVQQLWKEFESYCVDAINTIALADPKKESDIASIQTWAQVALETVTYPVVLIAEAFQDLLCTSSASSSLGKEDDIAACVAGEMLVGVLGAVAQEFISNPGRTFCSVVSRLKANFGVALGTVAFVLITTVFITKVTIFLSLVELKKGSPSKVAKELREKSSQLQKELDGWLDAFGKPAPGGN